MSAENSYLSVRGINGYYGESFIVQDVSFELNKGEVIALLGRNGAGKTSTLKCIARADDPVVQSGEIWFDGHPLHEMSAYEAARLGVQLVPEDRRIIPGLTVQENLELAQVAEPLGWSIDQVYQRFPRLGERKDQEAITLSGGEQQMLALGRALVREVRLLLLDEPYEGLAPTIVREIESIVQEIRDAGITTIIVEQNAVAALKMADRAVILDTGVVAYDGTAKEVLEDEALRNRYLAI